MSRRVLLQRIPKRNEQFGFPLPAARIREIEAGRIGPMRFDCTGLDSRGARRASGMRDEGAELFQVPRSRFNVQGSGFVVQL